MAVEEQRKVNFGAGPATLPLEALRAAQHELLNFDGSGVSVLEMSHRSPEYARIHYQAKQHIRELLNVPSNYRVLFLQGGGTGQFAAVALNLAGENGSADYIVTGAWSKKAAIEASKYCKVHVAFDGEKQSFRTTPTSSQMSFSESPSYIYYCANETINGVEFHDVPQCPDGVPLVADFSSSFMSRPLDVSKFGVVFAGAQKNVGPAGVTIVIVRDDLLGRAVRSTPSVLDYSLMAKADSLLNTPSVFSIYMVSLTLRWLVDVGGIKNIETRNRQKATLLYSLIQESTFYSSIVEEKSRSRMNIVFRIRDGDAGLEAAFVKQAQECGLIGLKGHRSIGGLRASIYNAQTLENVQQLVEFMKQFEGCSRQ